MSSASAAADVTDVLASAIPQLPPAIPIGLEAALGVNISDSDALVPCPAPAAGNSDGLVVLDNDATLLAGSLMVTDAAEPLPCGVMCMPEFWQAIATQTDLHSPAQARLVVSTALRLATEQARDHGSFRMGPYVRFTRVDRGRPGVHSSVDLTPLARVHQYAQPQP